MKVKLSTLQQDQIFSALANADNLFRILSNDTNRASNELTESKEELKPYRRRVFARTFFSIIEGICFCYRNIMLNCSELSTYKFTEEEILKLKEIREIKDSSGKIKQVPMWLETEDNLKVSFEWIAKFIGFDFKLENHSAGYQALLQTKKVRNNLMHPKKASNLLITDSEFNSVELAAKWFKGELDRLNQKLHKVLATDLVEDAR